MDELTDGLWRWTGRHPSWHPGEWGAEVASFALDAGDALLLVDPLVPEEDVAVLDRLDALARGPVAILITIPYHARSAERLWMRYRAQGCTIHGHPAVAKRLSDRSGFTPLEPGAAVAGGARAFAIGKPRRYETPLFLPSHRALAFGDALVTTPEGELRIWHAGTIDARRVRWYRERFVPTFEPLLSLEVDRILVTHGAPVVRDGSAALAAALEAPPWYHRP